MALRADPLARLQPDGYVRGRGLWQWALALLVALAVVPTMIRRQAGSVRIAVPLPEREGFLRWTGRVRVSAQALLERLHTLPTELFRRVLRPAPTH